MRPSRPSSPNSSPGGGRAPLPRGRREDRDVGARQTLQNAEHHDMSETFDRREAAAIAREALKD